MSDIIEPNTCPRCKAMAVIEIGPIEWGYYTILECLCVECGLIFNIAPRNVIYGVKKEGTESEEDEEL